MNKRTKNELLRIIEQLQNQNETYYKITQKLGQGIIKQYGAGYLDRLQKIYRAQSNLLGDLIDEINNIRKKTYPRWIQKFIWW